MPTSDRFGSGDGKTRMKQSISRRAAVQTVGGALIGAGIATTTATADEHGSFPPDDRTEWGPTVEMGEGEARTFVTLTGDGDPDAVGVYFTSGAWEGLPSAEEGPPPHFNLEFPDAIETTAFEYAGLDWGPEGHPPPGVYDVPHADIHFYLQDQETIHAIEGDDAYEVPLPDDQMPPGYIRTNEVVPGMGEHLIDPTAPEFQGEPFTHTFIWGAHDSELIFFEPMITIEFFEERHAHVCTPIKMPEAFPEAGQYPTQYHIRYLDGEDAYTVSLERFEEFEASAGTDEQHHDSWRGLHRSRLVR